MNSYSPTRAPYNNYPPVASTSPVGHYQPVGPGNFGGINPSGSAAQHSQYDLDPYAPAIVQDLLHVSYRLFQTFQIRVQTNGRTFKISLS